MIFTSIDYLLYLSTVFLFYWLSRSKDIQNVLLLLASYFFYGYIHPKLCILLFGMTIVNFFSAILIEQYSRYRKWFLATSVVSCLAVLAYFKYYNFFITNINKVFSEFGFTVGFTELNIILPVGISFYTFQTLSYTIDIYRGELKARRNFIDFALFVSFFPQLVAGPIERAKRLLPQIETARRWDFHFFGSAWPLLIRGVVKKIVIADNVAIYADKVFMLEQPSLLLLTAGTLAFSVQIFADFSAYTDIARGSARLLGFKLIENFNTPYLSISPSDFWRRWHISFSTWIRDYLYIPLGGSRSKNPVVSFWVIVATMSLCGLWHGAEWNFVLWGTYHGLLIYLYRLVGIGSAWVPANRGVRIVSCAVMFLFICFGWCLFRTTDTGWLFAALITNPIAGISGDSLYASGTILMYVLFYLSPLVLFAMLPKKKDRAGRVVAGCGYGFILIFTLLYYGEGGQDFIYFQF